MDNKNRLLTDGRREEIILSLQQQNKELFNEVNELQVELKRTQQLLLGRSAQPSSQDVSAMTSLIAEKNKEIERWKENSI